MLLASHLLIMNNNSHISLQTKAVVVMRKPCANIGATNRGYSIEKGNLHYHSRTCWWNYQRGAGAGQRSWNREKCLIIRNCWIMHAEMLSVLQENSHSSKPIWLPVRGCGPYRIWIKWISRAEKQFHTDFTLNCQRCPSCVEGILITLTHNGKI